MHGLGDHLNADDLKDHLPSMSDLEEGVPHSKDLAVSLWDAAVNVGVIDFMTGDPPGGFVIGGIHYWRGHDDRGKQAMIGELILDLSKKAILHYYRNIKEFSKYDSCGYCKQFVWPTMWSRCR